MDPNAAPTFSSRIGSDADLDESPPHWEQTPELCRAAVTQHGSRAAGEHGRHPAPLVAQPRMSHRIDAAVNLVQASGADPALHGIPRQAGLEHLSDGGDPVLEGRDACNGLVRG